MWVDGWMDCWPQQVQSYSEAFAKIQAASGIAEFDDLMSTFISAEDENYRFYKYVDELTQEISRLEEQILDIQVGWEFKDLVCSCCSCIRFWFPAVARPGRCQRRRNRRRPASPRWLNSRSLAVLGCRRRKIASFFLVLETRRLVPRLVLLGLPHGMDERRNQPPRLIQAGALTRDVYIVTHSVAWSIELQTTRCMKSLSTYV